MILKRPAATLLCISALFLLQGCGGNNAGSAQDPVKQEMRYARNLSMEEHDGYTFVRIRNPWDTTRILHSYILLEKGESRPEGFGNADVIRIPIRKSVVYSSVHASLIEELGAGEAISGVCDTEYISHEDIRKRIAEDKVADCGNSMSANVEKIMMLAPDAVLASPYENTNGYGRLDKSGIPVIECADYVEASPLARAEWMRFYGRLYGAGDKADSLFSVTEREYNSLKEKATAAESRPKVIFDRVYGQVWSVPGGRSTTGLFINDAGGLNIFGDNDNAGSLQLSPEKVLYEAEDADVWFIRYTGTPMTLDILGKEKELYTKIKAYKEGNVYGTDSSESNIFEDQAFHPQFILEDMIGILHPELLPGNDRGKRYYHRLEKR